MSDYKVVSLFSGCGGMDLGFLGGFDFLGQHFEKHNFNIIWANELNKSACETYRHNVCKNIINDDIWNVMSAIPGAADVVIGGFPCQDISINGKRAGVSGKRSGLYLAMVKAVEKIRPKIFIAENVKSLLFNYNEESLNRVIHDFSSLGYNVSYALYNAADYGVPQTRERVMIIGTPKGKPKFDHPQKTSSPETWMTCEKAIGDLENLAEEKSFNHTWSRAKKSPEQGSRSLKATRPATTMRAECHGNIQFHYKLDRRISMREAARFQSFPDSFIFKSNLRETERQVGNAVPPILAWHVAESVKKYLEKHSPQPVLEEKRDTHQLDLAI